MDSEGLVDSGLERAEWAALEERYLSGQFRAFGPREPEILDAFRSLRQKQANLSVLQLQLLAGGTEKSADEGFAKLTNMLEEIAVGIEQVDQMRQDLGEKGKDKEKDKESKEKEKEKEKSEKERESEMKRARASTTNTVRVSATSLKPHSSSDKAERST